jgi:hypothetical protein
MDQRYIIEDDTYFYSELDAREVEAIEHEFVESDDL